MKKIVLLINMLLVGTVLLAQTDSWKITWKKKTILQASKEDENANTKKINKIDLDKAYSLEITYKEADPKKIKSLTRSFLFFGETDNELFRKDSTRSMKLSATELKKLFGDKKKIKVYTIAIPSDPNMAARVRVRRVHLCTLELQ